jgi:kinesin family protein 2/24
MMGNSSDTGLYMLAARDIFQNLKEYPMLGVGVSFYEIYCGKVYDLLSEKKQLFVREDAKQNVFSLTKNISGQYCRAIGV